MGARLLLSDRELADEIAELAPWSGTTSAGISATVRLADFEEAIAFVNEVAVVAEELNHHPDIVISWNKVTLSIISHSEGGVTPACVQLAQQVNQLIASH